MVLVLALAIANADQSYNCNYLINGNVSETATDSLVQVPAVQLTISKESLSTLITGKDVRSLCSPSTEASRVEPSCNYNTRAQGSGQTPIITDTDNVITGIANYVNIDNCATCTSAVFTQSFDENTKQLHTSFTITKLGFIEELLFDIVRQRE